MSGKKLSVEKSKSNRKFSVRILYVETLLLESRFFSKSKVDNVNFFGLNPSALRDLTKAFFIQFPNLKSIKINSIFR